jgi:cell wall-associated NlpC family hydrolase
MFLTKEVKVLNKGTLSVVIALTLSVIMNGTVLASPINTNSQISEIHEQKQDLETRNEKKLSKLSSDKAYETKLLSDLKNKESILAKNDTSTSRIVDSVAGQVQKIRAEAPRLSRGSSGAPASSNSIIAYASTFQGVPYVYGGNGPSSFDCAGFTCYVFAHFGISLPRVASDQQNVGIYVSTDQLQPGDLVFFGSPAHHVGIYVGDGCMIHAPHTGDVVKISPLHSDFSGGRRVLQ